MFFDSPPQIGYQRASRTAGRGMHAKLAMAWIFKIVDEDQVDTHIVDQPFDHPGRGASQVQGRRPIGGILIFAKDILSQVFGAFFNTSRLLETGAGGRDHPARPRGIAPRLDLFLKDDGLRTSLGSRYSRRQTTTTAADDRYVSFEGPVIGIPIDWHSFSW
jgi:hypothetical protein